VAVLSSNRIAWNYTDDAGVVYRVAALKAWTDQAVLGGSASSGAIKQKPWPGKLRRTVVRDAAGHSRVVPVYEAGAPIATAGTAFNFNANVAGVITEVSGTSTGVILHEGNRHNVTVQTT
jgi:hypothetical protein